MWAYLRQRTLIEKTTTPGSVSPTTEQEERERRKKKIAEHLSALKLNRKGKRKSVVDNLEMLRETSVPILPGEYLFLWGEFFLKKEENVFTNVLNSCSKQFKETKKTRTQRRPNHEPRLTRSHRHETRHQTKITAPPPQLHFR
jgi:hypothetical protein